MEMKQTEILYSEVSAPKRSLIKSDVVLWVLVVLSVFALVFLGSFFEIVIGTPGGIVQIAVYLLLLGEILLLYRVRLVSYRYVLTERMFSVTRVLGKKERYDASIHLVDIAQVRSAAELAKGEGGKRARLFHGKREEAVAVIYRVAGEEKTLLVSMTESMRKKLVEQWKTAKRS